MNQISLRLQILLYFLMLKLLRLYIKSIISIVVHSTVRLGTLIDIILRYMAIRVLLFRSFGCLYDRL